MSRRNTFDDLLFLAAKLPWWLGLFCALLSYLMLHWYSMQPLTPASSIDDLFKSAYTGAFHAFAAFGQYILPLLFLLGALISTLQKRKRNNLFDTTSRSSSSESLNSMSWRHFEFLVGEYFRRRGFSVEETGAGADGGVDLIAVKDRERYLIQCKQCKTGTVDVEVVLGVMTAEKAKGGIVVTSGEFSQEAAVFARANKIQLINGRELHESIRSQAWPEVEQDEGKSSPLKRLKWVYAALVVVLVSAAALLFTELGRPLYFLVSTQIEEFLTNWPAQRDAEQPGSGTSSQKPREKELIFTEEQIRQAMADVLQQKRRQQEEEIGGEEAAVEPVRYRYEIELHTGGWIYTDNAVVSDEMVTYTGARGLVVSLNRDEVKSLKKVRE
jgi:restriction system protein